MIYSIAQVLGREHAHAVHLLHHGLVAPEGYNIVEMAAHRRDVFRIGVVALEQSVCKAFLVGGHLHGIAGFKAADGHHFLARAPVDHVSRCGIVEHRSIERVHITIFAINDYRTNLNVSGQRVVVHLHGVEVAPAGQREDLVELVTIDMAEAALLHQYISAVENSHDVVIAELCVFHCSEPLLRSLGIRRAEEQEEGEKR